MAPDKATSIKTIGVISAVGDTFYQASIGFTVFGNDEKAFPIANWGVDDFVVERLSALLRRRYDVRRVAYAGGAFAEDKIYFPYEGGLFGDNRRPIEQVVREEVGSHGLDAYVVVTKSFSRYGATNQTVRGLGAVKSSAFANTGVSLHALYWITVIDGRDFKVIGDIRAPSIIERSTMEMLARITPIINGPHWGTDPGFATQPLNTMTPQMQGTLRNDLQKLLADSFTRALREVRLLD